MTGFHYQKRWQAGWWHFMFTYGQGFGFGLLWFGRWNSPCLHFGPVIFDVQAPLPKSWHAVIETTSQTEGLITGTQSPSKEWLIRNVH